jgi:hypothetical protein
MVKPNIFITFSLNLDECISSDGYTGESEGTY